MLCQAVQLRYAFIRDNQNCHPVRLMYTMLSVHHSGYYQWLKQPESNRARENQRLTALIKESWLESGGIYGSPRIHVDLREAGEICSENRVARLMNLAGLKAIRGYKTPRYRAGKPAVPAKNQLQREFTYNEPNKAWVTDITYIRTYEVFLYLAVVLDLYSRRVIGWSMKATLAKEMSHWLVDEGNAGERNYA